MYKQMLKDALLTCKRYESELSASNELNESLKATIRNMQEELDSMGELVLRLAEELRSEKQARAEFALKTVKRLQEINKYDPVAEAERIVKGK